MKCRHHKHQNHHKNKNITQDETRCSEEGHTVKWVKLKPGKSLQNDFRQNQTRFWARMRTNVKGRPEAGRVCDDDGLGVCGTTGERNY